MGKEVISDNQGIKIVILFIMGSTLVIGTGGQAGKDTWIAVILSVLLSIPVVMMYSKILFIYPKKDLFDIFIACFGKFFGKMLSIIFIWFSLHLSSLVLRNFGEFIVTVALPETPMLLPMALFMIACTYGVKGGVEVLGRFSEFFLILLIGLVILFEFLSIPYMDFKNIRPIMEEGIKPILSGTFSAFSFPFGETVIFLMIFSCVKNKKSPYKIYISAILLGGLIVAIVSLRNTLVLSDPGVASTYFPSYSAVSRINVKRFFLQRLEIAVSVSFLIAGFIKISFCLLAACKGVAKLFDVDDYTFIVTPMSIFITLLSYIIYDNIMEMFEWAFEVWPYYAFLFQVIIPFIVLIVGKIKTRKSKKSF